MDETEVGVIDVTDSAETIDAAWEDDYSPTPSTEATDVEVEADQADAEVEAADETTAESEEPTTDESKADTSADEYLELQHLDDPVRKVSKDEAKQLAQKGLDYDRIRGKLDNANQEITQLKGYKDFLEEIKGDFASIEDLMADTKAAMYIAEQKKKGNVITKASALEYVKEQMAKMPAPQPAEEPTPSPESINDAIRKDSFTRFAETYPNIKAKDIPQEVWDDVNKTNSLVASYAKWELKQAKEELENLKLENKNRARSAGSMKTKGTSAESIIDKYWNSDDF